MRAVAPLLALALLACERSHATPLGAERPAPASSTTRVGRSVSLPATRNEPNSGRSVSLPATRNEPNSGRSVSSTATRDNAKSWRAGGKSPLGPELEARYAWLKGAKGVPEVVDTLPQRFPAPVGYKRIRHEPNSFAAFLRDLPLAPADTPVTSYKGRVIVPVGDPRVAGVVALDIGKADLQQCADAVMRLHGEWQWSQGGRNMSYRAAAGPSISYHRYARGDRLVAKGASLSWRTGGQPSSDYAGFRRYVDSVFAWANTVSLEKQAKPVSHDELAPGDFFILPGNPGHTVLILDVATKGEKKLALLGQSFMPAQSFQILRPREGEVWFELDPDSDVDTPFWRPFPWTSLRRL